MLTFHWLSWATVTASWLLVSIVSKLTRDINGMTDLARDYGNQCVEKCDKDLFLARNIRS